MSEDETPANDVPVPDGSTPRMPDASPANDLLDWMRSLPKGTTFRVILPDDEPAGPTRDDAHED